MLAEKMDAKDPRFWYNGTNITEVDQGQSPENYLLIFDDIDQYFNKINLSNDSNLSIYDRQLLNCNYVLNATNVTCPGAATSETYHNYWALILVLFPIFTLFGNVLVILSVYRERTLQSATNYFIVSLALADLLVAVVVMPFAVYVLVQKWLGVEKNPLDWGWIRSTQGLIPQLMTKPLAPQSAKKIVPAVVVTGKQDSNAWLFATTAAANLAKTHQT